MEKFYCDRCRRLFEKEDVCDLCCEETKKITIQNHFQKISDQQD
ncbi:hypothetical protein ACQUWN_14490 [Rossellomorea aquimaris]|nr:hypothetical protein [Bacillus sp. P14.5]